MRESFSPFQLENTVRDTRYHLEFLASSIWAEEPALYKDYVRWVKVLFVNLGLPTEWLTGSLEDVRDAVLAELDPDVSARSSAIIDRALNELDTIDVARPTFIDPARPLAPLATRFLGAMLGGDRRGATRAILDAVSTGTPVQDIYTSVFEPVQLELGRLWHLNRISVAQEHFATSITEMAMSRLIDEFPETTQRQHTLVAACVGEELHQVGVRMVADFFEMGQWRTYCMGANTPASAIVSAVVERDADLLALSATMSLHVEEVAEIIRQLREDERTAQVKVMVGGYTFNTAPELWKRVGADGYASNARDAVTLGNRLVGSTP